LEDPRENDRVYLENETKRLGSLGDSELAKLSRRAEEQVSEVEIKRDQMTKQKYWVM
jgi:hypothetical protein